MIMTFDGGHHWARSAFDDGRKGASTRFTDRAGRDDTGRLLSVYGSY